MTSVSRMKKWSFSAGILAGFLVLAAPLFASPIDEVYAHRIDPSIIESMKKGPNAQVYAYRQIIAMIKSDTPVDSINFSTVNAHVLMYGKYNSPRGAVDIELRGAINDGLLEIEFPLGRVDAVLFDWEEAYARPDAIKGLKSRVHGLTFRESAGFRAVYTLERSFPYQLTVDIPYNPVTKNLMPPQPDFRDVANFVKAMESNEHSRAMLENNSTGLPAFVTGGGQSHALVAGYLLNTITWNGRDDRWEYAYDDDLKRVRNFPEIRRLLKEPEVKAFVQDGETRVKGFGGEKTGFSFALTKEGGRRLDASLVGRRVIVKQAAVKRRP
jgi:hypothetical protein